MPFTTCFRAPLVAGWLLAAVHAIASAETVPVPDGFGVTPTRRLERLIYAERTGELPNTVDRAGLEQVCRTSLQVGAATRMPVFEAGHDQPARSRSQVYVGADGLRRAAYTELTAYGCPEVKRDGPCHCTYRPLVKHSVEIVVWQGRHFRRWRADVEDGTGTLEEGDGEPPGALPAPEDGALARLFGPVVGRGAAAGWACAQRELPGAEAPRRTCLLLPDPKLPSLLHGRVATSSAGAPDSPMRQRSDLQRLVLEADADAAVFTPPAAITWRGQRRAAPRDFQL